MVSCAWPLAMYVLTSVNFSFSASARSACIGTLFAPPTLIPRKSAIMRVTSALFEGTR